MRMTAGHLFDDAVCYVVKIEAAFFAGDLGVEHHLKQQIAQFRLQFRPVLAGNRIGDFVGFFNGVRNDGGIGLFPIPRTTVIRIAQPGHHLQQGVHWR